MIFIVDEVATSLWHDERYSILDFLLEHLKIIANFFFKKIHSFLCNVSNRINKIWGMTAYDQTKWNPLA